MREAAEVPERLRRPHLAAGALSSETAELDVRLTLVRTAMSLGAVAIIASWSWPAPVTQEALEDLPSLAYDQIMDATQSRADQLRWSLVVTPETMADPKALSGESTPSAPTSTTPMPPPTAETSA